MTSLAISRIDSLIDFIEKLKGIADAIVDDLVAQLELAKCEADPVCETCSTNDLLAVSVDPDGIAGNGDEYTLYVHPVDQITGAPENGNIGIQWSEDETGVGPEGEVISGPEPDESEKIYALPMHIVEKAFLKYQPKGKI